MALLGRVVEAQAALVARWLGVGFVHGVMNTDNTSISGETLDYGPCAFLDEYDPKKKFSSIDHGGRYAFANQPRIAQWNLVRLAEALLPAFGPDQDEAVRLATAQLDRFPAIFETAHADVLRAKLGLTRKDEAVSGARGRSARAPRGERSGLHALLSPPLRVRARPVVGHRSGVALRQRGCVSRLGGDLAATARGGRHHGAKNARARCVARTRPLISAQSLRIEEVITAATLRDDFEPFEKMVKALASPYEEQPTFAYLGQAPTRDERVQATFCGT